MVSLEVAHVGHLEALIALFYWPRIPWDLFISKIL